MKKVLVLSSSDGQNDARVFKQVKALKKSGYHVEMISRASESFPKTHEFDGIKIHRVNIFEKSIPSEKTMNIAQLLFKDSPIKNDILQYLNTYHSFHKALANVQKHVEKIKLVKPKLDYRAKVCKNLWTKFDTNPLKVLAYRMWAIALRFSLFVDVRELRRAQKGRDKFKQLSKKDNGKETEQIVNFNFFLRPFWTYQAIVSQFSKKFFTQFDVIHVHDIYPLVAGYAIAKDAEAKLIYDAHEIEPERVPPLPDDRKSFIISLENAILPHTSKLITVGKECENYYKNHYQLNSSGVIFNSPITKIKNLDKDLKQELRFTDQKKILLYVGAVGSAGRGLDKVITALPLMSHEIYLVVLGPRHKKNDTKIQKLAESLNVGHRLILLPPVNHELLVSYIESADVGICPIQDISLSYRFSMPNKLFEMAFAGIPICCSALPEMKKFVETHNIGKAFNEKDPQSIADTVQEVLNNRDRYSLDGPSVLNLKKNYSWETQESKLVGFYKELFELPHPQATQ